MVGRVFQQPVGELTKASSKRGNLVTTVRQLYELQVLDWEIDADQARLATTIQQIEDNSKLASARRAIEHRHEAIRLMQVKQNRFTQQLTELNDKVKALDERMYGGSLRNPKEVEALQHEINTLREQVKRIEDDELLPLMLSLEENQEWLNRAMPVLAKMEQERSVLVSDLTKERSQLEARLSDLQSRRQDMAATFTSAALAQYDALRRANQGQAIAKVERGLCTGCRVMLPARELSRIRTTQDIVQCNSCSRILFVV